MQLSVILLVRTVAHVFSLHQLVDVPVPLDGGVLNARTEYGLG